MIVSFIIKLFARLYVRVGILLKCGKPYQVIKVGGLGPSN